jgi:glycolate oxidase FAD binding subunit
VTNIRERLADLLGLDGVSELALDASRSPLPMAKPTDEAELCAVLELAARDGLRVLPVGAGSRLTWCRPPTECDLALSTRRLAGVVAYEPGDGTLTALAGTPMDVLARTAADGGHHVTPDVPRPAGTTLGGVLAGGASGFDRLRHGPARWHLLGTRVAEADGRVTTSGGRLVKNVTGYDLHRLYCGSQGSLCVILEASLRLFPLPERRVVVRRSFPDAESGLAAAWAVARLAVEPLAVVLTDRPDAGGAPWSLEIVLGGRKARVAWERGEIEAALGEVAIEEDGVARAALLRDLEPDPTHAPALHLTSRPSRVAGVLSRAHGLLGSSGVTTTSVIHPGVATVDLPLPASFDGLAGLVRELRSIDGARVAVRGTDLPEGLEPLDPPRAGLALMRRLRGVCDPDGRFATGRVL